MDIRLGDVIVIYREQRKWDIDWASCSDDDRTFEVKARKTTKIEVPRLRFRSGASQVELVDLSELCRPPDHAETSRTNASDGLGKPFENDYFQRPFC